jgi:ADP-heptose:LPS heptosyltransferase
MQKNLRQILWLPTGGQIGDALMALSVLAEFLEREPDGRVIYLARRNATIIADLARAYPRIQVVHVPKNSFKALLLVARLFLSGQYIVEVPPTPGNHSREVKYLAALFKLLRGNRVTGVRDRGAWEPYTNTIVYDHTTTYLNNVRRQLRVDDLPVSADDTPPLLQLSTRIPKDFLLQPQSYIAVHPFPTLPSKSLPMRRWRTLLVELSQKYPELSFVITGSKENDAAAHQMAQGIPRTIVAIGYPILEVAGIIKDSALYIGVDTGITHLAGVLQHTSVVLGQRSSPTWLPYYNPNTMVLLNTARCTCDNGKRDCLVEEDGQMYYRCLYDITDDAIFEAVDISLKNNT